MKTNCRSICIIILLLFVEQVACMGIGIDSIKRYFLYYSDSVELSEGVHFEYVLFEKEAFRFHPVNGFDLKQTALFHFRKDSCKRTQIGIRLQYAFSKRAFEPAVWIEKRVSRSSFRLDVNRELVDWKREMNESSKWFRNTWYCLAVHKNEKTLVDKWMGALTYSFDSEQFASMNMSSPHIQWSISAEYYKLRPVRNEVDFDMLFIWGDRSFKDNVPENYYVNDVHLRRLDDAVVGQASFSLSPNSSPNSPKFSVGTKYVFNDATLHLKLSAEQDVQWNDFGRIYWRVRCGHFFGRSSELTFHEWQHFLGSKRLFCPEVSGVGFGFNGFVDYGQYVMSTNDLYADLDFRIMLPRMVLRLIPALNNLHEAGEELYIRRLLLHQQGKNYTQVGYGYNNILKIFRVGLLGSFCGSRFDGLSFRMNMRLNAL